MEQQNKNSIRLPDLLSQSHPFRQWKRWQIPGTNFTLIGYSRSNDKTFFYIPELKCGLDAGLCEGRQPDHIFLTHTHNDHAADIEFLASKGTGTQLYAPLESIDYIKTFIRSKRELNYMAAFDPTHASSLSIQGVGQGDTFSFGKGQYRIRVVQCFHKIPCVGYCFSKERKRLTPEFQHLKEQMDRQGKLEEFGKMIVQKKREGVKVQEVYDQPLFVFMGDTHARVFAKNLWLFDYPVIITECTYLDAKEENLAERNGHNSVEPSMALYQRTSRNNFCVDPL